MVDRYKSFRGILWPLKDGKPQMDEEPEISYEICYREGLDIQEVTKRLISNFVESVDAWARCEEKDRVREEMKKALPVIIKLLNNPEFVKTAEEKGYRFDIQAIFKAFTDAVGWKTGSSEIFLDAKKDDSDGK